MKKRLRFYFETSVWRTLIDPTDSRRKVTYRLTTIARRRHLILVSQGVVDELQAVPNLRIRQQARTKLRRIGPKMIPYRPQVRELAQAVMERAGWGLRRLADVTHIGYAMVGRADVLVSWDVGDLAREHTRRLVAAEARSRGLDAPDIATPPEVLEEWLGEPIQ